MTTRQRPGALRLGLVGLGTVAQQVHLPLITRRDDLFEISGVVDLDPAALTRTGDRWNIPSERRFPDVSSLIEADDVDALVVMNSGQHSDSVIAGLDHGLAVLCEKPLAFSQAEVERVRTALNRGTGQLMIGYMKVHDPAVKEAQVFIGGRNARAVDIEVVHPSEARQLLSGELAHKAKAASPSLEFPRNVGVDEALGEDESPYRDLYSGILLGSIIHEFSVLRALGAPLRKVTYAHWNRGDSDDATVIIVGTGSHGENITIRWYYLDDHPTYRETVHWVGTDSDVSIEFPTPYVLHAPTTATMRRASGPGAEAITYSSHRSAFELELELFAESALKGAGNEDACEDALADVQLAQQVVTYIATAEGIDLHGEFSVR